MSPDSSSLSSLVSSPPAVSSPISRKRKRSSEHTPVHAEHDSDEPVLSHAARRKQKKREKEQGTSRDSAESTPAEGKKDVGSATKPMNERPKRQNSVWVGNLSFKTTSEGLSRFFDGVGEITRVHMPTKMASGGSDGARRENRGFAYVDFGTPDTKTVAITMSEQLLDGRRLLIKDGDDFSGRPSAASTGADNTHDASSKRSTTGLTKTAKKILASQKQPPAPTLFFGNLAFDVTDDSIKELLSAHQKRAGPHENASGASADDSWIRKIRLGTFEDSGKCKGWAFVDFTSIEHATAALTNPRNYRLHGRDLVVEYASPDAVRRGGLQSSKSRSQGKHRMDGTSTVRRDETKFTQRKAPENDEQEKSSVEQEHPQKRANPLSNERTEKKKRPRPTPGAALALAKREQVAIVPSEGTKITFS